MSCSTTLEEAILSFVSTSKVSKKEIQMHIKSSRTDEWNKKDVKRALKQLVSDGKLCIESDLYVVPSTGNSSSESSSSEEESGSESDDGSEEQRSFVPIAQRMQKQSFDKVVVGANTNKSESQKVDIDEEIRRLEAELAAADSESDDEQSSGDSESDVSANNKRKISFGKNVTRTFTKDEDSVSIASDNRMDSSGVICLSESASERIEPLPASAMPQIARKAASDEKKSNKRKRNKEEHTVNAGLKSAVEDLLSNYKTRSEVEQTPWYCRVCQHQAEGESDFLAHRASEFHKTAMKEHQKKNYCRMCRKQMTSVVQFQEHLQSRPHRDMLAGKRAQQQARGRGYGRGHRSGAGRGRGCVSRGGGSSKRQWC
ncbi:hypothetical protein ACHAWO_005952 [Cyclotella atomus]|uniref:U1-type domain-containing protein n=1 Tax=Cyclotella atomus TaxID=382360 RepID=A0ABD3NQG5_9STRA